MSSMRERFEAHGRDRKWDLRRHTGTGGYINSKIQHNWYIWADATRDAEVVFVQLVQAVQKHVSRGHEGYCFPHEGCTCGHDLLALKLSAYNSEIL
jgi:hypothetical protein